MTKEEIRMVGIFVAGRVAAKEKEVGISDVTQETSEQKNQRMVVATSEFMRWLYDARPEFLPQETKDLVKQVQKEVKEYN